MLRVAPYAQVMHGSVTVHMAASADRVWDLVSDITRVGEFSPETFEGEWLGGASGPRWGAFPRSCPAQRPRAGVLDCRTVVACDPGREFAFAVAGPGGTTVNTGASSWNRTGGTDVTESFQLADTPLMRLYWMAAGFARGRTNLDGMWVTLERIKAVTESAGPSR